MSPNSAPIPLFDSAELWNSVGAEVTSSLDMIRGNLTSLPRRRAGSMSGYSGVNLGEIINEVSAENFEERSKTKTFSDLTNFRRKFSEILSFPLHEALLILSVNFSLVLKMCTLRTHRKKHKILCGSTLCQCAQEKQRAQCATLSALPRIPSERKKEENKRK